MDIKLHKYLLLYVAVVLLNSCVDAQKKDMLGGDNADTKEEAFPNFIYHSYMCFGKNCEEAIITGIAKDSIHLYKDIVGTQTDSIIKIKGQRRSSVDGLTEYPADAVHKEGKIGDSVQLRSKAF